MTHTGQCYCGEIQVQAAGEPQAMGYCHCASCRAWSASPVNAFSLWKPDEVKVTRGQEKLASVQRSPMTERMFCRDCGGHLMARHPTLGLTDVYVGILPSLDFQPQVHVNYADTVLPMKDGLPKFRDFPAEFGGSGELADE